MVLFVDLNKSEFDLESCNVVQLVRSVPCAGCFPLESCRPVRFDDCDLGRVPTSSCFGESRGKLENFLHERNMIGWPCCGASSYKWRIDDGYRNVDLSADDCLFMQLWYDSMSTASISLNPRCLQHLSVPLWFQVPWRRLPSDCTIGIFTESSSVQIIQNMQTCIECCRKSV